MEFTLVPHKWKEYIYHKGISWNSQSIGESGLIPGGKENDMSRKLNPFGSDPDAENFMMITLFLRKHITQLIGNKIEMQYIGQFSAGSSIAIWGTQNDLQSFLTLQCQETALTE